MFAAKRYPEFISPEELDQRLAEGWYRMGQTIFTTHFLCFGEDFYSAVWIRLPLREYRFRKSLRKIRRKVKEAFTINIQSARITEEKEELYRRYRNNFPGMLAPTLRDSLQDGEAHNIFNTYEVCIYDGDRLIAASFFDLGSHSLASILGIYHPHYRKYSLGLCTMLEEIEFGMQQGFDYYYPGYIVPGYSRFDYKQRIGDTEYLDIRDNAWHPISEMEEEDIPIVRMEKRLWEMQRTLQQWGIKASVKYYPLFEANLFGFWRIPFFDYPVMLLCSLPPRQQNFFVVVFDPRVEAYQLLRCNNFDDIKFYFNEAYTNAFTGNQYFMDLIMIEMVLAAGTNREAIAKTLSRVQLQQPPRR